MSWNINYNTSSFSNGVNINKFEKQIKSSFITITYLYLTIQDNIISLTFESQLTSGDIDILNNIVSSHDGLPTIYTPNNIEYFYDPGLRVIDSSTGVEGPFLIMQCLIHRRELFNDIDSPLHIPNFTPILGDNGSIVDIAKRTLNLEEIHNKGGFHYDEIKSASYKKPKNVLFYYGWLNSFNSSFNQWNNEKVAQDLCKYDIIVLGDGVQDPAHPDYANALAIISRIQNLKPRCLIFGYVSAIEYITNFQTKASQWNDLLVNGIFMDEAGYDFGGTREAFNERVNFVHNLENSYLAFVNSWNSDHVLGIVNDVSFPNNTFNPNLTESVLTEEDWLLLESFGINTESYAVDAGYETKDSWAERGIKAINHRYNYGINLCGLGVINNGNSEGENLFKFGYISSLMFCFEAFGTSDVNYAASSSAVYYWTRPDLTGLENLWDDSPSVMVDNDDSDIYLRYVGSGTLKIDFSSGAQQSSITKY